MAQNSRLKRGQFELYTGPMFSGKTEEMKLQIHKLRYREDVHYLFFRPKIDTRDKTIRQSVLNIPLEEIFVDQNKPLEILEHFTGEYNLVAIDEVMLFSKGIAEVIEKLQKERAHVIAAGLDLDFRGEPFGEMGSLLARANYIKKISGVCMFKGCSDEAERTQRLVNGKPAPYDAPTISIQGEKNTEVYQCRCLKHHVVPKKPSYF